MLHPGVAQLVARMVRVHEAVGSTPATRTKNPPFSFENGGFFLLFLQKLNFKAGHGNTAGGFLILSQEGCFVSPGAPLLFAYAAQDLR